MSKNRKIKSPSEVIPSNMKRLKDLEAILIAIHLGEIKRDLAILLLGSYEALFSHFSIICLDDLVAENNPEFESDFMVHQYINSNGVEFVLVEGLDPSTFTDAKAGKNYEDEWIKMTREMHIVLSEVLLRLYKKSLCAITAIPDKK